MTPTEIARAICCPLGCRTPDNCCTDDTTRSHLVDIHTAAARIEQHVGRTIHEACAATIRQAREAWRARGPMSRVKVLGEGDSE